MKALSFKCESCFHDLVEAAVSLCFACEADHTCRYYRYYADIRQTISASDQEMNSALAELSRVSADRCAAVHSVETDTESTDI